MLMILLNSPCLWKPIDQLESVSAGAVCGSGAEESLVMYLPKLNSILFLYHFSCGDPRMGRKLIFS